VDFEKVLKFANDYLSEYFFVAIATLKKPSVRFSPVSSTHDQKGMSPSVSVFLGGLWLWVQVKIANYMRDRDVRLELSKAQKTFEGALNNPKTSESHKARIRKQLEKLEQLSVDRHMERIKSLNIVTEEEIIERNKAV
jgi:hypothetical protein